MTQHTPEFLRQRSSNLSLRMAAHANASPVASPAPSTEPATSQQSAKLLDPAAYTKPFCDFLQENPTVFHVVDHFRSRATKAGYTEVRQTRGTAPALRYYGRLTRAPHRSSHLVMTGPAR